MEEEDMNNSAMVSIFNGCWYDAEHDEIHWPGEGQKSKACLDCNGLASEVYIQWEVAPGVWSEWKKMPDLARISINEALRLARSQGFKLEDLGQMILDSDLKTVILEK